MAILRPLLTFTRKQIEGHAFAWKVPYREDKTNASTEYRRNSIRHEVFPLFERMNPSYVRTLNREMTYFKDTSDIVEQWCRAQLPQVIARSEATWQSVPLAISTPALLAIPQWRYLLYYILEPYGFNSATLESLEGLLESDRTVSGKRFESATHLLYTERDTLVVKPVLNEEISDRYIMVPEEGIYELNGVRWQVEVLERTPDFNLKQPVGTLVMDADKMAFPFVCRAWKQGDWLVPFGLKGRKKVSDLFADLKFTQIEKARALMMVRCDEDLAENQHIAGVLGYRIDDRYKVDSKTRNIVLITKLNNTDTI